MNKRYALCVGNNYPGTDSELYGCVNDAHDWTELLARSGYQAVCVTEPTKQTVMGMLFELVEKVGWADRIVFTYSGHGSWIRDTSGDEEDRRDEVLVMSDYLTGDGLLTDDELANIFAGLPFGAGALFLSDSCHSGTVSRFAAGTDLSRRPRFMSPHKFTTMTEREVWEAEERLSVAPPRPITSLISGCEDAEYSYDAWFDDRANGAFSKFAMRTYKPGITLNNWHKAIRTFLPNDWFPQSPVLTPANLYRKYTRAL